MALSIGSDKNALQPRYRRLLGVGALLDESVRLFREHWRTFAATSAVALVPSGVLNVGLGLAGAAVGTQPALVTSLFTRPTALLVAGAGGAVLVFIVLNLILSVLWTAAVTGTTDSYLRAARPTIRGVYGLALRRLPRLIGAGLLVSLGLALLTLLSVVLVAVTLGILGMLIAAIGLLVWWLKPTARRSWLKWLIVLTAPFGLPTYVGVRWSMFVPAIVVEDTGAPRSLGRSGELVRGEWFRAASVLSVASLIVGVLVSAPAYLVDIPLGVVSLTRTDLGTSLVQAALRNGVAVAAQILFASIGTVAYTLLFVDLRNRREGTDLAERLAQLEAPLPASPPGPALTDL
jgi:hypothetical protein